MAKIIIHNDDNTFEMSNYTHYQKVLFERKRLGLSTDCINHIVPTNEEIKNFPVYIDGKFYFNNSPNKIWKVEAIQPKWRDGYYFQAYCIECNNNQNGITLSIYNRNSINPFVKTNIELFQNTTTILKRGSDNGSKEVQSAREYVD